MLRNLLIVALAGFLSGCDDTTKTTMNSNNTSSNSTVTNNSTEPKTPTVMDQKENKEDVTRTADIRKNIVAAKLSTRAENAKVITKDGHVTLTGTVDTAEEKSKLEEIAKTVAGEANVENLLEVKAPE